jgi:hypothetical protein
LAKVISIEVLSTATAGVVNVLVDYAVDRTRLKKLYEGVPSSELGALVDAIGKSPAGVEVFSPSPHKATQSDKGIGHKGAQ